MLVPYVLVDQGNLVNWRFDLTPVGGVESVLGKYGLVRNKVKDLEQLFAFAPNYSIYRGPIESEESAPDTYFISPVNGRETIKYFTCLMVDEWNEFFPNTWETTGVAFHFDAPQAEAPNAILIAVPPSLDPLPPMDAQGNPREIDYLVQSVQETINLMQIRMIGSDRVAGSSALNRLLPVLKFDFSRIATGYQAAGSSPASESETALFPFQSRLQGSKGGPSYFHVLASSLSDKQRMLLKPPVKRATRVANPTIEEDTDDSSN